MDIIRKPLRYTLMWIEGWFDSAFGAEWNPLYYLGGLGYYYFWIVGVSGIYVYIFFDTGIPDAYLSVEYISNEQWWLAGIMRSVHRYASDALVAMGVLHITREFAFARYHGNRWFSWVTGIPMLWLIIIAGITGYWLVWDMLAQYVAVASTELLDWLPIFGEPLARNFLAPGSVDSRFFTLLVFMHIAVPLVLLFVMWIHLQRVAHARFNPPRGLAIGTLLMLVVLSVVHPVSSQGIADLGRVASPVELDWFYMWMFPLADHWGAGAVWIGSFALTGLLMIMPWLPPLKRREPAKVHLEHCNGCTRCAVDCPYSAITMKYRSDGLAYLQEAVVDPDLCLYCGICVGSCPTATPFRRAGELLPGIDLPDLTLIELRNRTEQACAQLQGPAKVLVFGCDHGLKTASISGDGIGEVSMPCAGMLPPSFIDYVISRKLADGVVVTGCRRGECHYRLGQEWLQERLDGTRDPRLRKRVPRERVAQIWAAPTDKRRFNREVAAFRKSLEALAQDGSSSKKEAAQ